MSFQILLSQDFVEKQPQLRNLVLEEFTGIHCGNCPGGEQKAAELAETYPGRVVIIAIHEGYYAIPNGNEPDFRTKWGTAILNSAAVTGFPSASINRMRFPGTNVFPYYTQTKGGLAISVSGFAPAAEDSVLNGTYSPLNIGAKIKWNNDTREIEIETETYFTSDIPGGVKLNIALLESHVWGPQTGASNPANYEHNHILRELITGQWGELISASQKDSIFMKTYKFTVSPKFQILNCDLAIYATQANNDRIFTGNLYQIIPPNSKLTNLGGNIIGTKSESQKPDTLSLKNVSDKQITFKIAITKSTDTPADWSAVLNGGSDEIILDPNEIKNINLNINTGATKGV